MESDMNNEIYQNIIKTLQYKVDVTLGTFAKEFIERSDYETLALIAKIGESTTFYFEGLSTIVHFDEEPTATIEVHEVPQEIKTEDISTETPKSTKRTCVRGAYGVEANVVEKWVEEYLLKRGGRALKNDLYEMFYKTFSNQFNAYDLSNGRDKPKWKQNVCDRIQTMRKKGIVAKSENGTEYNYYTLDPEYYANLKKSIQVQPTLPFPADKEMTA
jgi:hypothetical protein